MTGKSDQAAASPEGAGASGEEAERRKQLEQDMATVEEGLRLMLTNKLQDADALFASAGDEAAKRTINLAAGERDPRGAFAFVRALTALLHGLATLENNQLIDALERLTRADELVGQDGEWAGKTVLKGLCVLLIGIVQSMQGNLAKGVWHMLRSWMWLRRLEAEALPYEGPERGLVRSTALLALGVFNLVVSLLPPYLLRTASFLSGFSGDRDAALGLLRQCREEEGLLAPFAAVALVGYQVDVRTFLGEPRSDEAFEEANEMLTWAEKKFPGGIFFSGLRANYYAVGRDVEKALEMSNSMAPMAKEMPALGLVMHARRASYAQANLDWSKAAHAFRDALAVYQAVGRRSMCPAMSVNAAFCHELAEETEKRDEMVALALEYQARKDKSNWGIPDKWAFGMAAKCQDGGWDAQLELFQLMTIKHRSTLFMPVPKAEEMLGLLKGIADGADDDADRKCRCIFLQAEMRRQLGQFDVALEATKEGMALQPSLSKDGQKAGWVQYMHFVAAASHFYLGNLKEAKEMLKKLDECPHTHDLGKSVSFKAAQLSRRLGLEIKDAYTEVAVPARSSAKVTAQVPEGSGRIEWDWTLADYTVTFTATFRAEGSSEAETLQCLEKYDASSGPASGGFEPKGPGVLELVFDNSFSMLRGKSVICRLQPEELKLEKQG